MKLTKREAQRIWRKQVKPRISMEPETCWLWPGCTNGNGYGSIGVSAGVRRWFSTHVIAYVAFVGKVPRGLQLDHLCRNRACVNPDHLEAVTPRENFLRGMSPSAILYRKGECGRGHKMEGDNLLVFAGGRQCRACKLILNRQYYRRRKARRA